MRIFASILGSAGILGAGLLGPALPAYAESLPSRGHPAIERAYPNESYAQYYYRRGYYYHHHNDGGSALAAGAVGLAAGALIGSAIASQSQAASPPPPPGTVDPSMAAYCARKYRSYDPVTGTFMARNGMRYVCTYP